MKRILPVISIYDVPALMTQAELVNADVLSFSRAKLSALKTQRMHQVNRPMETLSDLYRAGYRNTVFGFTNSSDLIKGGE